MSSRICRPAATRCSSTGSRRTSSSAFRNSAISKCRNIGLELRQALEPWHVLGEEGGAGSTVRYVDSSLERVQVKARGLIDKRHVIAVGGRAIPLHPTGTNGEYVAGVRYRAWQPPNCLHPTIGVHAPLSSTSWTPGTAVARRLHLSRRASRRAQLRHLPVNTYEAESRRLARFFRLGHTPGPMSRSARPARSRVPLHARSEARLVDWPCNSG